MELGLAREQVVEHRLARLPEILRDPVEQLGVADFVLDLGGERQLAAKGRSTHQPLALGQDAHELRVGVHLDEAQDGRPVLVGHGVDGLDLAAAHHVRLEPLEPRVVRLVVRPHRGAAARPFGWRQDRIERERVGHGISLRLCRAIVSGR